MNWVGGIFLILMLLSTIVVLSAMCVGVNDKERELEDREQIEYLKSYGKRKR